MFEEKKKLFKEVYNLINTQLELDIKNLDKAINCLMDNKDKKHNIYKRESLQEYEKNLMKKLEKWEKKFKKEQKRYQDLGYLSLFFNSKKTLENKKVYFLHLYGHIGSVVIPTKIKKLDKVDK